MKIELTQGKSVDVDDEFFNQNQKKWCYNSYGYAVRYENYYENGKWKTKIIYMHKEIMGAPPFNGMTVDHEDGNKLNNQKTNLRWATRSQQQQNRKKQKSNTSGYIGVSWSKGHNKWRALIKIDGKYKHLGYFVDKIEAAKEYDKAAYERDPEFAELNFK